MQNKGFVKVFAVLLTLVCIYYLSFSFVTRHYENKAAKMEAKAGEVYLDSLKNERVWLGAYTLKQCREMQIGLGLDLKGGMNVILEVSVPEVVKTLADHSSDPNFVKAVNEASAEAVKSQTDFISLFVKKFQGLAGKDQLCTVFATQQLKGKVTTRSKDSEVESVLRSEVKSAVDNSYTVIRTRIDQFGVAQPNIQTLEGQMGRIMVEMPGIKEPDRIRKLLQGSANLEFWETYDASVIVPQLASLDAKLIAGAVENDTVSVEEAQEEVVVDSAESTVNKADLLAKVGNKSTATADKDLAKMRKEHPLLSVLQLVPSQSGGCMVGYALSRDTAEVNKLIASQIARNVLPEDLKLLWGVKPSEVSSKQEVYELYAIRMAGHNKPECFTFN